jgi:D-sedoheptulose 7-phosphate isomerase
MEDERNPMRSDAYVRYYLDRASSLMAGLDAQAIATAVEWIREAAAQDRTIYACGNGGSGLIASHMTSEMVKHASYGHPTRFKMVCLADNIGTVLSYANDVNFESIFVEPLKNFAQPGDLLIAISGSGDSENVLRAVDYANQLGCRTIGLTRADGGRLRDLAQLALTAPENHMGHLEDCFFVMTHVLCYAFIDEM